ncbi:hypothetical protein F2Q70_00025713 [Brassica cretica]|uniref:Uncharacterized protein n=1 Tax=Brassica cretica TaxID=69181 RepID=A0A8S9I7R2_BRACR|nr:hypothetical protein F2Q68_00025128 [Brassica cretica]KAF2601515.1 hypothetical protein F2Q70_00025713 [Brassica cretica]
MKPPSRSRPTSRDDVPIKNDETDISFEMIISHTLNAIKPTRISRRSSIFHLTICISLYRRDAAPQIRIKQLQPEFKGTRRSSDRELKHDSPSTSALVKLTD